MKNTDNSDTVTYVFDNAAEMAQISYLDKSQKDEMLKKLIDAGHSYDIKHDEYFNIVENVFVYCISGYDKPSWRCVDTTDLME